MKARPAPRKPAPAAVTASRLDWRPSALLAAVVLAAYVNSLGLGVAMDAALLVQDPRIQASTWENVRAIFTGSYWWSNPTAGLYRPLTTLSLLFNCSVLGSGERYGSYHLFNLLLHLANALLVYLLARKAVERKTTAWLAAAVWAVHPVGVESVANIAGRADLLATAAVLAGLLWYVRSMSDDRANPAVSGTVMMAIAAAAVLSKESGAVLAGLMLLWDLSFGRGRVLDARRVACYGAAVAAAALLFAIKAQQTKMLVPLIDNPMVAAGFLEARLTALKIVGQYLWLLVSPWRLSSDYSYRQVPNSSLADPAAWFATLAIGAILAAVILRRKRDPALFFAAGWFGVALFPTSNLAVLIGSVKAERFLYLPAIGFGFAAAVLAERAAARWGKGRERAVKVAVFALLGLLALRSAVRNPDWMDDVALWSANVEAAPGSFKTYKGLASALYDRDPERNLERSAKLLESSYAILREIPVFERPNNVLTDLAICYRLFGDRAGGAATEAGREWYRKSLALLLEARQIEEYLDDRMYRAELARGVRLEKVLGTRELFLNLGNVYLNLGNTDAALEAVRKGRLVEPHNPAFHVSLAAVHMQRKEPEAAAIVLLEQVLIGASSDVTQGQIRGLYDNFPDGACAFEGGQMNFNCPRLHRDACTAVAGVVKLLNDARQTTEAKQLETTLPARYGCQ